MIKLHIHASQPELDKQKNQNEKQNKIVLKLKGPKFHDDEN